MYLLRRISILLFYVLSSTLMLSTAIQGCGGDNAQNVTNAPVSIQVGVNQDVNVNTNVNVDQNVNVNTDVNVNTPPKPVTSCLSINTQDGCICPPDYVAVANLCMLQNK